MGGFNGFDEKSLLYAENYNLVETLKKVCNDDISNLFSNIERKIVNEDWYDKSWNIKKMPTYVQVFKKDWRSNTQEKAWFTIYMSAGHLGQRKFEVLLSTGKDFTRFEDLRNRLQDLPKEELQKNGFGSDNVIARGSTILKKTVDFELDKVEDTIMSEMDNLQKFSTIIDECM